METNNTRISKEKKLYKSNLEGYVSIKHMLLNFGSIKLWADAWMLLGKSLSSKIVQLSFKITISFGEELAASFVQIRLALVILRACMHACNTAFVPDTQQTCRSITEANKSKLKIEIKINFGSNDSFERVEYFWEWCLYQS